MVHKGVESPWYEEPEARAALAARDVGAVYRLLQRVGVSQREIARRTGQSQSEVSAILRNRTVLNVMVLERICDGLDVPRAYMRLAGVVEGAYPGGVTSRRAEVDEEMYRRGLLGLAGVAFAGEPVLTLGKLVALPGPSPVPVPSRVEGIHVARVRTLTRRLGEAGNPTITEPEVLSAATAWASALVGVPGTEPVMRALAVAVAELHIEAGWAGRDAWRYGHAMHHFTAALELANQVKDAYLQAITLIYAGSVTQEHGHLNDALKMLQLGLVKAGQIPRDEQRAVVVGENGRAAVQATAYAAIASVLADLKDPAGAEAMLATGRELWSATRADHYGDLDRPAALLALRQGHLDAAEPLAAASVGRWEGVNRAGHARSSIVLATVHVRAGEPSGLPLAHGAITAVRKLGSVRTRKRLQQLAAALEAQPGRDAQDLARMARQAATARA